MKKKLSNQSLRHIFKSRSLLFLVLFFYLSCSKDDGYDDNTYTITQTQKQTLTGYTINVTAQNSQDYSLSGNDANGSVSGNDPEITISVGETINFIVRATGHPFYLKTDPTLGSGDLVSGATEQGTTNGTVTWTPTNSGTYYYVCSLHTGMYGILIVLE